MLVDCAPMPGTHGAITGSYTRKIIRASRQSLSLSMKQRAFILAHFNRVGRVEDEAADGMSNIWHANILPEKIKKGDRVRWELHVELIWLYSTGRSSR
jgi:hypothetical protein